MKIDGRNLKIKDVVRVARDKVKVSLDENAQKAVLKSREIVDRIVLSKKTVYGVNTGFGKFSNVSIGQEDLSTLQKNLIMSHACGVGEPFEEEIVRAMILLRVNALSIGNSGIRLETINTLIEMLNKNIIPVIPKKGSLGASGDLAPLAHMALPMLGLGEVFYKGKRMPATEAFQKANIKTINLGAKEGLALINGTQAMNAIATLAIYDAVNLSVSADIIASMTIESLRGVIDAFDERLHKLRNQKGQIQTAFNLRKILSDSKRTTRQGEIRVQDAYTLRCIPQIHGISKEAIAFVENIIQKEINAVTDNPVIFEDEAISGGNFHGQYLSMSLDFLGIALSELANVSERRTERLVNPQLSNNLPAFLVKNGGLNSGFMIPQYVAAALVSENKVLSHPASVDSITSSANQEDHVSMGMTAAIKARQILENLTSVLAIELLSACQAIELDNGIDNMSKITKTAFDIVRNDVEFVENDKYLSPEINKCIAILKSGKISELYKD